MIIKSDDGNYYVTCIHDPDRVCCLGCQRVAARSFIYNDIPRNKWPMWLQDKYTEIIKEDIIKDLKNDAPLRTVSLLERILEKLNNMPFMN